MLTLNRRSSRPAEFPGSHNSIPSDTNKVDVPKRRIVSSKRRSTNSSLVMLPATIKQRSSESLPHNFAVSSRASLRLPVRVTLHPAPASATAVVLPIPDKKEISARRRVRERS